MYFSPSIAALLEYLKRLRAGIVTRIAFAKRIGPVQFADDGIIEVLVGVEAHCHHASIAVAREDDSVATLHIVSNLRKLVTKIGNRSNVRIHSLYCSHSKPFERVDAAYFIIIMIPPQQIKHTDKTPFLLGFKESRASVLSPLFPVECRQAQILPSDMWRGLLCRES